MEHNLYADIKLDLWGMMSQKIAEVYIYLKERKFALVVFIPLIWHWINVKIVSPRSCIEDKDVKSDKYALTCFEASSIMCIFCMPGRPLQSFWNYSYIAYPIVFFTYLLAISIWGKYVFEVILQIGQSWKKLNIP